MKNVSSRLTRILAKYVYLVLHEEPPKNFERVLQRNYIRGRVVSGVAAAHITAPFSHPRRMAIFKSSFIPYLSGG